MFYLLSLLASILTGRRPAIAPVSPRGRARTPVVTPPWDHLDHMFACFERLYADWRNAILPDTAMTGPTLPATGMIVPGMIEPGMIEPGMTAPRSPTPPPSARPQPPHPTPRARSGTPAPPLRQRPRPALDAITPAPNHFAKPA